jgi:hypothetical protein
MRKLFLICAVALNTAGCASPVAGQSWGQALGGLAGGSPPPPQAQSQGYLPAYSMRGVLLGSMPAQSVTGLMGWTCTYQVTALTTTQIWLDHQCPPTMQFQ